PLWGAAGANARRRRSIDTQGPTAIMPRASARTGYHSPPERRPRTWGPPAQEAAMSTCRLTVQAAEGAWQGEVTSWTGLVVLAAVSAEAEPLGELAEAVRRYLPEHRLFDEARPTADGSPVADGPWCLIDLAGRTVVAGGDFELPDSRGAYQADTEDDAEG